MCIIVDANFASGLFNKPASQNTTPILSWLFDKDKNGSMVLGGKLAKELNAIGEVSRTVRVLLQAGRAFQVSDSRINKEEQKVIQLGICISDDPHVIALARISGARTLCSYDKSLHADFKNKNLVDQPRGCVYQTSAHKKLLRHTVSCKR